MSTPSEVSVEFIDAPPPSRGRSSGWYESTRAALRLRPGRWAVVFRAPLDSTPLAYRRSASLRRGTVDIESTARTEGDEVVVYARAVAR